MLHLVKGYKPFIGNTSVLAKGTKNQLTSWLRDNPPDAGGFVNYSVEVMEQVPEEFMIRCPHCSGNIEDPRKVIQLP